MKPLLLCQSQLILVEHLNFLVFFVSSCLFDPKASQYLIFLNLWRMLDKVNQYGLFPWQNQKSWSRVPKLQERKNIKLRLWKSKACISSQENFYSGMVFHKSFWKGNRTISPKLCNNIYIFLLHLSFWTSTLCSIYNITAQGHSWWFMVKLEKR